MVRKNYKILTEIGAFILFIFGFYLTMSTLSYVDGGASIERIVSVQLSGMSRIIQGFILSLLGTIGIVFSQNLFSRRIFYVIIYVLCLIIGLFFYITVPVAEGNLLSVNTNVSDSIETSLRGIIIVLRSSVLVIFGGIGLIKNLITMNK